MSRLRNMTGLLGDVLVGFVIWVVVSLILVGAFPGETNPDGSSSSSWMIFPGFALGIAFVVYRRQRQRLRAAWVREWNRTLERQRRYESTLETALDQSWEPIYRRVSEKTMRLRAAWRQSWDQRAERQQEHKSTPTAAATHSEAKQPPPRLPEMSGGSLDWLRLEPETVVLKPLVEWRSQLLLQVQDLPPAAFEFLTRDLLLVSGLTDVRVTGGAGDGGIDGVGYRRALRGSFPVYFQCKRYQGSVKPSEVRDFRGAMDGRAGHGVLITTGSFTSAACDEAERTGAKSIELVDGDALVELMREHQLGLVIDEEADQVLRIDDEYFRQLVE